MESQSNLKEPNIIIPLTGAFSTGKTEVFEAVKSLFKDEKSIYFLEDLERKWLIKNNTTTGRLTPEQRERMHSDVFIEILRHINYAEAAGKTIVADSFLFEIMAYSKPTMGSRMYEEMRHILDGLMKEKSRIWRVIYFPTLQNIEKDGVRSTSRVIQQMTDRLIVQEMKTYNTPYYKMPIQFLDREKNIKHRIEDAITKILHIQNTEHIPR